MTADQARQFQSLGHVMLPAFVSSETVGEFRLEASRLAEDNAEKAHGIRHLLARSAVFADWARSADVRSSLPEGMMPVRGILFDKVPGANWQVAWHQDLSIAVAEKADVNGYGPWSLKDGVVHVQPPLELLAEMVALRLHLDETPTANGALRVLPGSHLHGKLTAEEIHALKSKTDPCVCEASAGDLMLMKPLLLHASSASANPGHRRVVHVEYARKNLLDSALRWMD